MADIQLMEELSNAFGPSGFEEEVCQVIYRHTREFQVTNDAMCNVYMRRKDFSAGVFFSRTACDKSAFSRMSDKKS